MSVSVLSRILVEPHLTLMLSFVKLGMSCSSLVAVVEKSSCSFSDSNASLILLVIFACRRLIWMLPQFTGSSTGTWPQGLLDAYIDVMILKG